MTFQRSTRPSLHDYFGKSQKSQKHKIEGSDRPFYFRNPYQSFLILRARTWPGGLTQPRPGILWYHDCRVPHSRDRCKACKPLGKLPDSQCLSLRVVPLVTCLMGKGTRAAAHTASKSLNQERGNPSKHDLCQHRKLLLQQVQLNLWVRFLWMSTFRPPK
jgi:hypothetical protein